MDLTNASLIKLSGVIVKSLFNAFEVELENFHTTQNYLLQWPSSESICLSIWDSYVFYWATLKYLGHP